MDAKLEAMQKAQLAFDKHSDNPDYAKNYAESLHACVLNDLVDPDYARDEYKAILALFPRLYRIKNYMAETLTPYNPGSIEPLKKTVADLEDYYRRNPTQESLAEDYALALWLLLIHPDFDDYDDIIMSLSELLNNYPDNETISEKYFNALDFQTDVNSSIGPHKVTVSESKQLSDEEDICNYANVTNSIS